MHAFVRVSGIVFPLMLLMAIEPARSLAGEGHVIIEDSSDHGSYVQLAPLDQSQCTSAESCVRHALPLTLSQYLRACLALGLLKATAERSSLSSSAQSCFRSLQPEKRSAVNAHHHLTNA